MRILLAIIFLSGSINTLACDCKEIKNLKKAQQEAFKNNDLIFIAEVIESRQGESFRLRVIELFKGELSDSILTRSLKKNYGCESFPKLEDGYWLIYTNRTDEIHIDECGLSRSFRFPYLDNNNANVYPPPPSFEVNDIIDHQFTIIEHYSRAMSILQEEIEQLRAL